MKPYEWMHFLAGPFLPAHVAKVKRDLKRLVREKKSSIQLLDVGGRKSPYTVGLHAEITVVDLPRESEVQQSLNLGLTETMLTEIRQKRSNINALVLEDMTTSTLPDARFEGVLCVEVIEHVPNDEQFIQQLNRVLKAGGFLFLTTPNGDYVKNEPPHYNPDHIRHYTRKQLTELLSRYFSDVQVTYGIKTGKYRYKGLRGFSLRRPLQTAESMFCNLISKIESRGLDEQPKRTAHLFAVAKKAS